MSNIGDSMTTPDKKVVAVTTAVGTHLFSLMIANDRIELLIDETALGDTPDDRLKILFNGTPVTVAPEAIIVLTVYLSSFEGPGTDLN